MNPSFETFCLLDHICDSVLLLAKRTVFDWIIAYGNQRGKVFYQEQQEIDNNPQNFDVMHNLNVWIPIKQQ